MTLRGWLTRLLSRTPSWLPAKGSGFVPMRDELGNVRGIMDAQTAAYLASNAPDPSQSSLDEVFGKTTRLRFLDGGTFGGRALGNSVLVTVSDPDDIAALHSCLTIVEDRDTFAHCMCLGDQALELYCGAELLATIGIHHGRSVRWDAWKHDARLEDGHRLLMWLAARGATGPLQAHEAARRRSEESDRAAARWREAIPPGLQPFWERMQGFAQADELAMLSRAHEAACPDPGDRALELFRWYGSGVGRWTGFPMYEIVPAELLLTLGADHLVAVLMSHVLTPAHLEGAARFFAAPHWTTADGPLRADIPSHLKRRLLAHSVNSPDRDKVERARFAFGD